ncbi:MAG: hypothetical protein ACYDCK_06290 [Thermoplasmatota archaeon]
MTFATALHSTLAAGTALVLVVTAIEGGVRAAKKRAPGAAANTLGGLVLVMAALTAAGGLAIFALGARPKEWLHFLYAVLIFAIVPIIDRFAVEGTPRAHGIARAAGAALGLVLYWRLFVTGPA